MAVDRSDRFIEFHWPDLETTIGARMWFDVNLSIAEKVWNALPIKSLTGHAVVAGDGIWLATRIVHLGPNRMVKRARGDVYFFATGQSICLTYGSAITESAKVNKFGQVLDDDLEGLGKVGRYVWDTTVASAGPRPVRVEVRRR